MAVNLSFIGGAGWQFFDDNGDLLVGGKIYTYAAGTTTPLATYTDRTGTTLNTNPIILDSAARTPAQIWSTEGLLYKYVVNTSANIQIRVWDNIGGSVVASDLAQDLAAFDGATMIGFGVGHTVSDISTQDGSKFVGYLPTGTGAVATTVQTKLREGVSVKDFGAVGDGVTDDTNAIQAAVNFVSLSSGVDFHRNLYFPSGRYLTTQTVSFDYPGVNVCGDGRSVSIIYFTGIGIAVQFTNAHPNNGIYAFGGRIEDICIEGNVASTDLLRIKFVNHFYANNINLKESNTTVGVGLHVLGTVAGYFGNIVCSTNAQLMSNRPQNGIILDDDPTSSGRASANTFVNMIIEGMTGDGVQLIASDHSTFLGGTSENNGGNGITITGSRINSFIGVGVESNLGFADIYDNSFANQYKNVYTNRLFYFDGPAQFSKVDGGYHQSITVIGDFITLADLKYSFFGAGGVITTSSNTSTRNLFNVNTSALTFALKAAVAVIVIASPFTYVNNNGLDEEVVIEGGIVTQVVFGRAGAAVCTLPIAGMYRLAPQDSLTVSYSMAPTIVRIPQGTNFI